MPPLSVTPLSATVPISARPPLALPATPLSDVTQRLWALEETLDLFSRQIDGVGYWERVRFAVGQRLLAALVYGEAAQERANRGWADRFRRAPQIARSVALRHPFAHAPVDTLFVGHPRRKLGADGRWWDLYCDPVAAELAGDSLVVERPYGNRHAEPAASPALAHLDAVAIASRLRGWWKPLRMQPSHERQLERIETSLFAEFGVPTGFTRLVERSLAQREQELPIFQHLLTRLEPSCVVTTVSYENREVTEAAHDLGIPVAEVQHGTVSRYHLAYSLPRCKLATYPDRLLTFGTAFNATPYPLAGDHVIAVGSAYHDEERGRHDAGDEPQNVVFLSQRPSGKVLTRWAVELAEQLRDDRSVVVKLHPAERRDWRERYPWLETSKVRVVDGESPSLYSLFSESCAQVGVNSTALYEGMTYPLRTFLAALPGVEHMEPATRLDLDLVVVTDSTQLRDQLGNATAPSTATRDALFRSDAVTHTCAAIEKTRSR